MQTHVIHKFKLDQFEVKKDIAMMNGAIFLSLQSQFGNPKLWYAVPADSNDLITHTLHLVRTGRTIPKPRPDHILEFRGTHQGDEGRFVVHIFDEYPAAAISMAREQVPGLTEMPEALRKQLN